MSTYADLVGWFQPRLGQNFDMPDWVLTETTTIELSLYVCVRNAEGSTPENDELSVRLRTTGDAPADVSGPLFIADGNTSLVGTACSSTDEPYTQIEFPSPDNPDLAEAMRLYGVNPETYEGLPLELYFSNTSNSSCSGSLRTLLR